MGELCLSPVGLISMTRLALQRFTVQITRTTLFLLGSAVVLGLLIIPIRRMVAQGRQGWEGRRH
jgi:dipeptide/tripeptide permease